MKRGRRHRWNALSPARWYEMPSASIFLRSASCFSLSKTNCIRDASCSALNFSWMACCEPFTSRVWIDNRWMLTSGLTKCSADGNASARTFPKRSTTPTCPAGTCRAARSTRKNSTMSRTKTKAGVPRFTVRSLERLSCECRSVSADYLRVRRAPAQRGRLARWSRCPRRDPRRVRHCGEVPKCAGGAPRAPRQGRGFVLFAN